MSGTEIRRFSDDRASFLGNWPAALIHAASLALAEGLTLPIVVFAAYVVAHSNNLYAVALVLALSAGTWCIGAGAGKFVTSARVRQLPWAFGASVVRAVAMALIAYAAYRENVSDVDRLYSIFTAIAVFNFAAGFASTPTEALLQKSTESSSRNLLFTRRAFWGALVAIMGGLIIRRVFGPEGPGIEKGFSYLFVAAAACLASAAFFTLLIREPVRLAAKPRVRPEFALLSHLRDRVFRRYLVFRVFFAAGTLVDAFLVPFAILEISMPLHFLGWFVAASSAAVFLTLPIFRAIAARRGGRITLQVAVWLKLAAPLIALTIPYLRDSENFRERISGERPYYLMITVCFVAIGASLAGQIAGNFQYLSEISPAAGVGEYRETTNSVVAFACLSPFAAAFIIDRWDFQTLFAVSSAIVLLTILLSGILVDTRLVAARSPRAIELRGLSPR